MDIIANIRLLQGTGDDLGDEGAKDDEEEGKDDGQAAWLVALSKKCEQLLERLPHQPELLQRTA